MNVIERNANDSIAAVGFLSDKLVAEFVVLQQLIAQPRDAVSMSVQENKATT